MLRSLLLACDRTETADKMDRYKNACRICIKEDGIKIPIFGEEGEYRQVASKIKDCLNIPVSMLY